VELLELSATYLDTTGKKALMLDGEEPVSVEKFVSRYFEWRGFHVLFTENAPLHVLFGVYMWSLIQDPKDPLVRRVGFGNRHGFDGGEQGEIIWTLLPEDFGTSTYARRRRSALEAHLAPEMLGGNELERLYDYWLEASEPFRQYLWAHRARDVDTARQLLRILPAECICRILRYLVDAYWDRYSGWPDLFVYKNAEFFFAEVKSVGDRLSQGQKQWIRGNREHLGLPFKLVKVHKSNRSQTDAPVVTSLATPRTPI